MLKEIKHINLLKLKTQNNNGSTIVFPKNTLEVSKLLKLCNKRKIEVVPIGGNTNRVKGTFQTDKTKSILMSLKHMNKIKKIHFVLNIITLLDSQHKYIIYLSSFRT